MSGVGGRGGERDGGSGEGGRERERERKRALLAFGGNFQGSLKIKLFVFCRLKCAHQAQGFLPSPCYILTQGVGWVTTTLS